MLRLTLSTYTRGEIQLWTVLLGGMPTMAETANGAVAFAEFKRVALQYPKAQLIAWDGFKAVEKQCNSPEECLAWLTAN